MGNSREKYLFFLYTTDCLNFEKTTFCYFTQKILCFCLIITVLGVRQHPLLFNYGDKTLTLDLLWTKTIVAQWILLLGLIV